MQRSSEPTRMIGSALRAASGRTAGSVINAEKLASQSLPMTLLGESLSEGRGVPGCAGCCPDLQEHELPHEQPSGPATIDSFLQHVDVAWWP